VPHSTRLLTRVEAIALKRNRGGCVFLSPINGGVSNEVLMKLSAPQGEQVLDRYNQLTIVQERCNLPALPYCLNCKAFLRKPKEEKKHGQDGEEHKIVVVCMAHGYEVYTNRK
jgi:hypothetical protein